MAAHVGAQAQTQFSTQEEPQAQNRWSTESQDGTDQRSQPLPNIVSNKYSRNAVNQQQLNRQQQQLQQPMQYPTDPSELAPSKKNNFVDYVQTATGQHLELFGASLFRNTNRFAAQESAQVNGDYVIGPGDELQIRGWGMIDLDVTAAVDRNGTVYLPRVGAVKVSGVKYRDLQGYLKKAVARVFTNFELTASISQSRALQIYVVGHAQRPGTYTVSSMSSLLNALFLSGGPAASGSMRNIQLKRGNEVVSSFDLYDVMVKGDKTHDATLRDGDVIYIPEVGPLVALTGNVKTPALYELKGERASVAELLGWAGGVDSPAEQKQVVIEKSVNNVYQPVADLVAGSAGMAAQLAAVPVLPTDIIRVFAPGAVPVETQLKTEYVRVSGEVGQSGVFQIRKGETLRELVARVGVTERGYIFATEVKRESLRRVQQQKLDEIANRYEQEAESSATARVASTTDKDAIAIQAAELERQRRISERLRSIRAEGRIALEFENSDVEVKNMPDLVLQDGDSIAIPRRPGTVQVLGSVFQPTTSVYKPRRTVKDYIQLAGGATASADTSEIYVLRADGTARGGGSQGWFGSASGMIVNPGDTIVVPDAIERGSWRQSLKEWTAIFYQFGLGAAGLKVLKD